MDLEDQSHALLAPTAESLEAVKVFPLIPSLKRDVTVRHRTPLLNRVSDCQAFPCY